MHRKGATRYALRAPRRSEGGTRTQCSTELLKGDWVVLYLQVPLTCAGTYVQRIVYVPGIRLSLKALGEHQVRYRPSLGVHRRTSSTPELRIADRVCRMGVEMDQQRLVAPAAAKGREHAMLR